MRRTVNKYKVFQNTIEKYIVCIFLSTMFMQPLFSQHNEIELKFSTFKNDTVLTLSHKEPSFFSFGVGAAPHKFINLYLVEANILFPFQQNLYFKTGLLFLRYTKYENPETNIFPIYLNFYVLYNFRIAEKINAYGGLGFAIFMGMLFSVDAIVDYRINSFMYLGLELKQSLNATKDPFYRYPFPSLNLTLKL